MSHAQNQAHQHVRKHALLVSSLVLVAGATAGCGGSSGGSAPESASTKDFCDSYTSVLKQFRGKQPSRQEAVQGMKDWADSLRETGTPKDIPDDARHGFEVVVDTIKGLDDNASESDVEHLDKDLSKSEQDDAKAFGSYAVKTCGDALSPESPELPAPSSPQS